MRARKGGGAARRGGWVDPRGGRVVRWAVHRGRATPAVPWVVRAALYMAKRLCSAAGRLGEAQLLSVLGKRRHKVAGRITETLGRLYVAVRFVVNRWRVIQT